MECIGKPDVMKERMNLKGQIFAPVSLTCLLHLQPQFVIHVRLVKLVQHPSCPSRVGILTMKRRESPKPLHCGILNFALKLIYRKNLDVRNCSWFQKKGGKIWYRVFKVKVYKVQYVWSFQLLLFSVQRHFLHIFLIFV